MFAFGDTHWLKDTEWIKSYEIKGKISGLETLVITEA
jgi:hypothetical protein